MVGAFCGRCGKPMIPVSPASPEVDAGQATSTLTPEERQRIYLEEKARFEIRQQLETTSPGGRPAPVVVPAPPSNGTAAVLSLFIPGAGQMYKGKVGTGILWLVFTILGYFLFIIPGLFLHFVCIFDAHSTKPA
jgi:hypothetical protein